MSSRFVCVLLSYYVRGAPVALHSSPAIGTAKAASGFPDAELEGLGGLSIVYYGGG